MQYRTVAALLTLMETMPYQQITYQDIINRTHYPSINAGKDVLLSNYIRSRFAILFSIIQESEKTSIKDVLIMYFHFWEMYATFLKQLNDHGLMEMFRAECKLFVFDTLTLLETGFCSPLGLRLKYAASFIAGALTDMQREGFSQEQPMTCEQLIDFSYRMIKGNWFTEYHWQ
jgi:hypothetical protein